MIAAQQNRPLIGMALSGALLLAGCAGSTGTAAPTSATIEFSSPGSTAETTDPSALVAPAAPVTGGTPVNITDFAFGPANLTVPAGTTVVWTNHDDEPHTVVARDGSFHSPVLDTNASYSFTFTNPGTFDYLCSIHPMMTATVVVTK